MKKKLILLLILVFSVMVMSAENENIVTQVSTINAALAGSFDGEITFGELKKYGNFGLGYFHKLAGEVVGVDGEFYRIKENGISELVKDTDKTPFMTVLSFNPNNDNFTNRKFDYIKLKEYLHSMMPRKKSFYAIKIEGTFPSLQARTFTRQMKPYSSMIKILRTQVEFNFTNTEGVLVGIYTPEFLSNLNIPGFHFHFLHKDKQRGGHVIDVKTGSITIEIVEIPALRLILPESDQFQQSDLSKIRTLRKELEKVEK